MSTPMPDSGIPAYDDPAAQFPKKDGVIDLTSVAAEEGVSADPAKDLAAMGDAEIGTATKATSTPTAPASTGTATTSTTPTAKPTTASAKPTPPKATGAPKPTAPTSTTTGATTGASNGSATRPTTP
jgi:hypothetical protein